MSDPVQPQPESPGLLAAVIAALRNMGSTTPVDDRAATARTASEETSKVVPPLLMPRDAIEQKRRQQAQMDEILRNSR